MANCWLLRRSLLCLLIFLHFDGTLLSHAQEEGVESEPSPHPTAPPTTEYPKTLTFSLQLFMANARFDEIMKIDDDNTGNGYIPQTLDQLFRYTLCRCVFQLPYQQCTNQEPIKRSSPSPTNAPTTEPTFNPTTDPTTQPTLYPTLSPTAPTFEPTVDPTVDPTIQPTVSPTDPTMAPTADPTRNPTLFPSVSPTENPSNDPTTSPTPKTPAPTTNPTVDPTKAPTTEPTTTPTTDPTLEPTLQPTASPTIPTMEPTANPTKEPTTSNPTNSPSSNPSTSPTGNPSVSPTANPSSSPTMEPTLEPTLEPTVGPTLEPTLSPIPTVGGRRLLTARHHAPHDVFADNTMRHLLVANTTAPTTSPSSSPVRSPSSSPSKAPSAAPTVYTVYDLRLSFSVSVKNREQAETVFDAITSNYFFNDFKQCLLEELDNDAYSNDTRAEWLTQILSMQQAPFGDVGIMSPTFSPTSYPTYNYQAGEDYGYWMIGLGICIIVAVMMYWAYRRYSKHQDYKEEQKSAPQANVELQSLFENVTPAGNGDESFKD